MKLLLDENLSDRIISRIIDLYPDSVHVKTLGLINTDDVLIWEYARAKGYLRRLNDAVVRLRLLVMP
ncbi:MAG: DUF5615 family PIN-like protein [Nostoc sp. DedQUE12b]|uniref:DUF5615 family PIN-like protein n=1 Tax=Nostoc sp. DedQUE12b TaxID=3075398 RepID=UPI002AD56ABE|nr:DUF5615 family PIN-like protein [Nostoc sp. DedQUE12b]MDZ8085639.1 DUF5615 family PIN-like protein [Nostoc sp. DedQUE12b]